VIGPFHFSAWKIALWIDAGIFALMAMDPTVRGAYIGGAALITSNGILGWVGYLNYKTAQESNRLARENRQATQEMSVNVDGHLGRLLIEKEQAAMEHTVVVDKLAHAEGRREGIEVAEDKAEHKPDTTKDK
jgi:hypothetical protein